MSALRTAAIVDGLARSIAGETPALYAITDNGVVTTDTHLTAAAAIERTRTLDARFPQHQHHFVPLYLHPTPTHR